MKYDIWWLDLPNHWSRHEANDLEKVKHLARVFTRDRFHAIYRKSGKTAFSNLEFRDLAWWTIHKDKVHWFVGSTRNLSSDNNE